MRIIRWIMSLIGKTKSGSMLFGLLPLPLSKEEERRYLEQMKNGDETARDKLIENNLWLVSRVVRKYVSQYEDRDDLMSIGSIGLMKAIKTYDPDHGTKLSTYAARCIENEVFMYLRRSRSSKFREVSLYAPIFIDQAGHEVSMFDILAADNDDMDTLETKLLRGNIAEKMKVLSPREQLVLEMRYGLFSGVQETQQAIARRMNISRSYVSRIEKKALEKISNIMGY